MLLRDNFLQIWLVCLHKALAANLQAITVFTPFLARVAAFSKRSKKKHL